LKKPSLFRRIIGTLLFIITLLAAVWLVCCAAASFVSPQRSKYLALFSLTAPFAVIVNVLLALVWVVFGRKKWRAFVPLLALGFSYKIVPLVFGLHPLAHQDLIPGEGKLKVMSWNVHGMGIFDKPAYKETSDKIIQQIKAEGADVLCLYEFYTDYNSMLKPYATRLMRECGYQEYHFKYDNTLGTKIFLGVAIFSRYPVSNVASYPLHTRRDGQVDVVLNQCDVALPSGETVRVFATHLQSFLLSDNEKDYLEEVAKSDTAIVSDRSKNFVRRFGDAYVKRSIQADSAAAIIAQSPYPVILCGDFNDLPGSYAYVRMRGKLQDPFAEKGFGLGHTYNLLSKTLRIDYILYDAKAFNAVGFRTPVTRLSDHNPVIANLELKK
jgi:endonuclease/exonuclease/phosphatase family metal-dependent hydrolase